MLAICMILYVSGLTLSALMCVDHGKPVYLAVFWPSAGLIILACSIVNFPIVVLERLHLALKIRKMKKEIAQCEARREGFQNKSLSRNEVGRTKEAEYKR